MRASHRSVIGTKVFEIKIQDRETLAVRELPFNRQFNTLEIDASLGGLID